MLRKRVFLVEDNPGMRACVGEALGTIGNVELVGAASTSEEARRWLSENRHKWDIAVIDIFLSKGHGFEVLRGCLRRDPHQKAVVLSNYTKDPVRVSAKSLGADAVFDKSLEMDDFLSFCANIPVWPADHAS